MKITKIMMMLLFAGLFLSGACVDAFAAENYILQVQTDKSVYYPGDTVVINGTLRTAVDGLAAAGLDVVMEVDKVAETPVPVFAGQLKTDGAGKFQIKFLLEQNVASGNYTIIILAAGIRKDLDFCVDPSVNGPTPGSGGSGGGSSNISSGNNNQHASQGEAGGVQPVQLDPRTIKIDVPFVSTQGQTGPVAVNLKEQQEKIMLTKDAVIALKTQKKGLAINGTEVALNFNTGTWPEKNTENLIFEVKKVDREAVTGITGNLDAHRLKLVGHVYEFQVKLGNIAQGPDVKFSEGVLLAMSYQNADLQGVAADTLAIYRYAETDKCWELLGGTVDQAKKVVVVEVDHFSKYAVMAPKAGFDDIQGHWAQQDIEDMAARKIIAGVSAHEFQPERWVTRAEFTVLMVRTLGLKDAGTTEAFFNDVSRQKWYYQDILVAKNAGIISGKSPTTFAPEQTITREEMVAIFDRVLNGQAGLSAGAAAAVLKNFSDAPQISSWARNAVASTIHLGIISGRAGKMIAPQEKATRAETAVMLRRLVQMKADF